MTPLAVLAGQGPGAQASVCRAREAQPRWAALEIHRRASVLREAARRLAGDADSLAAAIVTASGRPLAEVWSAEIVPTIDAVGWLARHGPQQLRSRPLARSRLQWYFRATRHELRWDPFGVVGIVTPGNSLLFLAIPQVAAALVAGNAVVWKPSPVGTEVAVAAAALLQMAGLEPGLLQVVPGGAESARAVVEAGVDKLFFTGGSEAGRALYRLQAERGRPVGLELSGRHVAIVLDGVDVSLAARGIVWGKLANGGRNCVSVQLVLVERGVADAFLAATAAAFQAVRPGEYGAAPDDGPRLQALVRDALARGARLVMGDGRGPSLLANVAPGMRLVDEEIQGPLLAVAAVDSAEQALDRINAAPHRLSASVWARDVARARRLAARLDVGQVWINEQLHPTAQPAVTLAGRGASGFGAARGSAGLLEMVQPKVVSETPLGAARRHYVPVPAAVVDLFRTTVRVGFTTGLGSRSRALVALARALLRLMRERA